MAAFSTVISEFSDTENRRTYAVTGHTVQAPKLLIQKRSVPKSATGVAESSLAVVYGTTDADGNIHQSKVGLTASVRYPADGQSSDIAAALVVFRDFVASDEFTALVNAQTYVQ
jgi:hypothetical protein